MVNLTEASLINTTSHKEVRTTTFWQTTFNKEMAEVFPLKNNLKFLSHGIVHYIQLYKNIKSVTKQSLSWTSSKGKTFESPFI